MSKLDDLIKQHTRPAARMTVEGKPPTDPTASVFGDVRLARSGETWPRVGNTPITPLCQINCTELPYRPPSLRRVALLAVFVMFDEDGQIAFGSADQWPPIAFEVREYTSLDELVKLRHPPGVNRLQPCEIEWDLIDDLPDPNDDDSIQMAAHAAGMSHGQTEKEFSADTGSKIGGWPFHLQFGSFDEIVRNRCGGEYEFVMQIAEEAESGNELGDCGIAWLSRAKRGKWDFWYECS